MSATPIVSRMLCMESDGIPTSTAPQVKGTDNQVKGTDNQVKGTDNQVKRTDNQVKGTDNQVKAWRATRSPRPLHRTPRQPLTARRKDSARETNGPVPAAGCVRLSHIGAGTELSPSCAAGARAFERAPPRGGGTQPPRGTRRDGSSCGRSEGRPRGFRPVRRPRRSERMGPIVEPHGQSFRTMNSCGPAPPAPQSRLYRGGACAGRTGVIMAAARLH
jgi:hypothetical protein